MMATQKWMTNYILMAGSELKTSTRFQYYTYITFPAILDYNIPSLFLCQLELDIELFVLHQHTIVE